MIGNDIVDLAKAAIESNWKRKGYLAKIFTSAEQQFIAESANPTEMVWILWSMKESAYKIYNRTTGLRGFAPTSLQCDLSILQNNYVAGTVKVAENFFYTKTIIASTYIHSVAAMEKSTVHSITKQLFTFPFPENYRLTQPDCISHHGRYLALVFAGDV